MKENINQIYSLALSYVTAKAVGIAAHHQLDKKISEEGSSITDLARLLKFDTAAFKRLLRVLEAHKIFILDQDCVYPTKLTQQLADVRSPHLLRAYKAFDELEYTLQTHEPAWDKVYGKPFYPSLNENELSEFAEWCQRSGEVWLKGLFSLCDFSSYKTVVDIGGGNGHFLAEMLSQNPTQKGILFDQPAVVATAETVFLEHRCLDRADLIGGDFFKAVPQGGDLYTICRTLLNWSDEQAIKILDMCANHMSNEAKLFIIDFVLPEKAHPHYLRTTLSDVNLLTILNSGNRTEAEWCELVSKSQLLLKKVTISNEAMSPEPFAPIIILECQRRAFE